MISNDNDLAEAVERVSHDLADIQKYLGQNNHPGARIRFPRGYLRNAVAFRQQLWYLKDESLKRNLAYAHILSDVFRWLINRTDLSLTAQEMVIKEAVCLMGAICESLTRGVALGEGVCGNSRRFKPRCEDLRDAGYISDKTCDALHMLWDARQNEHIFLASTWEYQKYTVKDYNRAVRTLHALKKELDAFYTKDIPF